MLADREIQQAATPGPWTTTTPGILVARGTCLLGWDDNDAGDQWPRITRTSDAEYIAHFHPERVGLLLDVLDAAHRALTSSGTLRELASALHAYFELGAVECVTRTR